MFYKAWRRIAVILIIFCIIYIISKALPIIGNIFHSMKIFFNEIYYIIKQSSQAFLQDIK